MAKITIAGAEVEVPDAVAEHLSQVEAAAKVAAEQAGRTEARTRAEEEAKRRAEQEAMLKRGEFDKVIELKNAEIRAVAERFRDAELKALAAAHPRLRKSGLDEAARAALLDDVVAQLRSSAAFDLQSGRVVVTVDGAVVDPRAHLDGFLSARPYLLEPVAHPGSGADPTRVGTGSSTGLRRSGMSVEEKAEYAARHGSDAFMKLPA